MSRGLEGGSNGARRGLKGATFMMLLAFDRNSHFYFNLHHLPFFIKIMPDCH